MSERLHPQVTEEGAMLERGEQGVEFNQRTSFADFQFLGRGGKAKKLVLFASSWA